MNVKKRWKWEDSKADLFETNLRLLSLKQVQDAGCIFINELKNMLITVMSASLVMNGQLTLGGMLAIQYIIGQLNSPIEQTMSIIYKWQDVSISLDRMNEIHSKPDEENEKRLIPYREPEAKSIRIKDLYFKYDGANNPYVLKNINLILPEGKLTAIVGASGSGKTTLIKLLLGYYSPTSGSIHIGSNSLENYNLVNWRKECGVVMQEGYLFSDSIANNISISEETVDMERLKYATDIANITNFIDSLPLGYDTLIGDDGTGVSQGQQQRILISRVVYKNPQFVFLDEATNALDANNEKIIVRNLKTFYKNKTVVIVAHRLSTVQNADQVVVLDNGELVEIGTPHELTMQRGKYYQLVKNQLELGS